MRRFGSKTVLVKLVSMTLMVPVKSGWRLRSVPFAPAGTELPLKLHPIILLPDRAYPEISTVPPLNLNLLWTLRSTLLSKKSTRSGQEGRDRAHRATIVTVVVESKSKLDRQIFCWEQGSEFRDSTSYPVALYCSGRLRVDY